VSERHNVLGRPRVFGWPEDDSQADPESWIGLRDRARKDLFWLGKEVLHRDLVPRVHQPVCDFFVHKNFDGVYSKDTTLKQMRDAINRQDEMKERILLDPRGAYKSTIDGIDCVQWMLNMPDIRIFIVTGKDSNADLFLTEIKGYFYRPEHAELTDFQLLFPEYIVTGQDGTSLSDLKCPARKFPNEKFATLWVNSVTSTLASLHCDILKGDDVVSDRNSAHPEARAKLKTKYDNVDNLRDEWGFADNIGTRYADDDWYGTRIRAIAEGAECAVFQRSCWTVKPQYKEVPLKGLTLEMVDLLFPEKLGTAEQTFKELRKKLIKNEIEFRCQQLNEPVGDIDTRPLVSFSDDQLRAHLLQMPAVPKDGDIFITWDTALTDNRYSDYSAGAVVKICHDPVKDKYCLYNLEIKCDRFKQSELAFQIVALNKKWNPKSTIIEKLSGFELLQREVQRQALIQGVSFNAFWKSPPSSPDAKCNRIKGLETLLNNDQLYFVAGEWIDQLMAQFCNYTGEKKNRGRKDDIPDALSIAAVFMPTSHKDEDDRETEAVKKMLHEAKKNAEMKQQYERIFGGDQVIQPATVEIKPQDPRNKIFGGNGLHI
jgi:phage terminase large subunit-like protein